MPFSPTDRNDEPKPPLAERRPKPRRRVFWAALVTYSKGAHSFDCTLRNVSETGAQVVMAKNAQFPSEFYLINIRDRIAYDVKVVWNHGSAVGVTFKKIYPLSDFADSTLSFLDRLWHSKGVR